MSKIDMIRQMRQKLLDITNAIESSKSSDLDYYAFQKIKAEEIPLEQMIKEQYSIESKIDKYLNSCPSYDVKLIKDFIEKMAIWYELRYSDYELNNIINNNEKKTIEELSWKNDAVRNVIELFDDKNKETIYEFLELLSWSDAYNIRSFIDSLTDDEQDLLKKPSYITEINFWQNNSIRTFYLTTKGQVRTLKEASKFYLFNNKGEKIKFNDINIEELVKVLETNDFDVDESDIDKLKEIIADYKDSCRLKEGLLDSVMYRIIERGGALYGPYRAFLFAKEFNRDIDIPMQYGIDYNFPHSRSFINEYLKAGGSKNLVCCANYFDDNIELVTIKDLLKTIYESALDEIKRSPEETELHQRFVDTLNQQITNIDPKFNIKQRRIERKLRRVKSKKTMQ